MAVLDGINSDSGAALPLRRCKRRRAGSHKRYPRFLRPTLPRASAKVAQDVAGSRQESSSSKPNRRMRRHAKFHQQPDITTAPEVIEDGVQLSTRNGHADVNISDSPAAAATKRLPTHMWFAKRFVLQTYQGWVLPEHAHGKGHRWRSLLQAAAQRALLHDESHFACVSVLGPSMAAIGAAISSVLTTHPHVGSDVSHAHILDALQCGRALRCTWRNASDADAVEVWPLSVGKACGIVLWAYTDGAQHAQQTLQDACASSGMPSRAHCVVLVMC
jgi:Ribonucleases P/MRP protein subunit POP1